MNPNLWPSIESHLPVITGRNSRETIEYVQKIRKIRKVLN